MENKYKFIHTEWTDICIINENNIIRESKKDEIGNYFFKKDKLIVNWNKWIGDDIFIKIDNLFYQLDYYEKFINKINLLKINLFDSSEKKKVIYYFNFNKNIFFKKNNFKNIYKMEYLENRLNIIWSDNLSEIFIKIDNNFYSENYIINLINNDNNCLKKEIYRKINNKYYLDDLSLNKMKDFIYKIYDLNLDINNIYNNLQLLINKEDINQNYININNIKKTIKDNNSLNILEDIIHLNINFEIPTKNKKRCLSLVEWGYPAFGGGENWLLNMNKILFENNIDNYLICFSDAFKNTNFTGFHLIDLHYVKIIQMEKNILSIIKIIKVISPDIINHQGINREFFMKISNILEIPFLTGFCFWQNIIQFNRDNINVKMLESTLDKTDDFNFILNNSYSYVASNFVNEVIYQLYNVKLDVIETISLKEDFFIENPNNLERKYVTLINCCINKGGYLIDYLCNHLNIDIPLQFIYTENDPNFTKENLLYIINKRNIQNNINIVYLEKIDIKNIYKNTKILLIPSICDETFCRVAYEGMLNNIQIISTKNGNLHSLLHNYEYVVFLEEKNKSEWKDQIEHLYMFNPINISINDNLIKIKNIEDNIKEKIENKINSIKESKYKLKEKNIGLIIPWADQGLGIQARDYYITLQNIGFKPHVLSFKPYHSSKENKFLQTDNNEWNFENIIYSENYRENLTFEEIIHFIHKYNIKKIIIIEATFTTIFKIALFLKLLNIQIYLVVNIECIRLVELNYHDLFTNLLTNNNESYKIIKTIFGEKTEYLGFHLNYPYYQQMDKKYKEVKKIKFCCMGGLNSLSRKNINLIIQVFYKLFEEKIYLNWELNIYIQGVEIPEIINKYKCDNIFYHVNNLSYKEIINKYYYNDIFIHLGSHEGLGLGFYESLYIGLPVITLNWIPNNEIIQNYINGWLIDCDFCNVNDNDNSIINRAIVEEISLNKKVIEILTNIENTNDIIKNTIQNKENLYKENKITFEKKLMDLLSI